MTTKQPPQQKYFFNPLPAPGDIVLCLFPAHWDPNGPGKPRPGLVTAVNTKAQVVKVAYGTSKKLDHLYPSELLLSDSEADFTKTGLLVSTKFDLGRIVQLEYSNEWFLIPNHSTSHSPKLGTLPFSAYASLQQVAARLQVP